jgi:hypothetical protein
MIHRHHFTLARVARLLPVLAVSVLLSACAAPRAYPPSSGDVKAELTALGPYLQPSALTPYDSPHEGDRGGLTPRAWRDVVVNARVRAIDLQFNAFQQDLSRQGVGVGIATDWVSLALNAAGALVSSAANVAGTLVSGTAHALSATAAGLGGVGTSIDQKVFFDTTMPTLLATMVAQRKVALVRIHEGLTHAIDAYPLTLALNDLDRYYQAGTIAGALSAIADTAGATATKAEAHLERLVVLTPVPAVLQGRRAQAAAVVNTLDQRQLDALARALDLPPGPNARVELLIAIAQADSTPAFDRIAQTLAVVVGTEL